MISAGALAAGPALADAATPGAAFSNVTLTAAPVAPALASPPGAVAWGEGFGGRLGDGSFESSDLPVKVSESGEVSAVAAGQYQSLALLTSGGVVSWGTGEQGQLGNGKQEDSDVPVEASGISEASAIAAGTEDSMALLRSGRVDAWGTSYLGELGNGTREGPEKCVGGACSMKPVPVSGITEAAAISAGEDDGFAVLQNGSVKAWGYNGAGELGDGNQEISDLPQTVQGLSEATSVAAGSVFTLALLKNGHVMAWGANSHGQLGDGSESGPESCTCSKVPIAVIGLSGVVAIAAGSEQSLALLANGTVDAWGGNEYGELGNGTTSNSDVPIPVPGLTEVVAIAAGNGFSLAVLKNGTIMAWGNNTSGQLGNGTTVSSHAPVRVDGLEGATAVSGGGYHSLAIASFAPAPSVTQLEPSYGPASGGTTVKVKGTHLANASNVKFGSNNASSFKVESEEQISAVAPPGKGTIEVKVASSGGESPPASGDVFNYGPIIKEAVPSHGPASGGTSVTITGSNFNEVTAVDFGSSGAASFTVQSAEKITAVAPPGSGTVALTVDTAGGSSSTPFSYAPSVEKVTPSFGPKAGGTPVTITGSNFTSATEVKFGSSNATSFKVESEGQIAAISPAGAGTVDVTVIGPGGASPTTSADRFIYGPSVTGIEPTRGTSRGGTLVTITGINLGSATGVDFGGVPATTFRVNSPTSVNAIAPPIAGEGPVDVTVVTPEGTSPTSSADTFTYFEFSGCESEGPPPVVSGVSPSSGTAGATARVIGSGFFKVVCGDIGDGLQRIYFGAEPAKVLSGGSETERIVEVPPGSGTVDVRFQVLDGRVSAISPSDRFTYTSPSERFQFANTTVTGSLTLKRLGQAITLPEGSSFTGSAEVNTETGAGTVNGALSVPPFVAPLKLFGIIPASLGLTVTESGSIVGSIAKGEGGKETVTAPAKLNLDVTSLSMFGLKIPSNCPTAEPVSLALADTLTLEELGKTGLGFAGNTTLPQFMCHGDGFLSAFFGPILSSILSGPENAYTLKIGAP